METQQKGEVTVIQRNYFTVTKYKMIELQYFEREDFNTLINWAGSKEFLMQWAGPSFTYPLDEAQLEKYIEGANVEGASSLIFKAVEKDTQRVVGHISLSLIDRENKSARIGRVLIGAPDRRGKNLGEQMLTAVLRIGFEELALHRISLGVFDFNQSAIQCYKKVGFTTEGLLRHVRKMGEEYWNLYEMSILEEEWKNRKTD